MDPSIATAPAWQPSLLHNWLGYTLMLLGCSLAVPDRRHVPGKAKDLVRGQGSCCQTARVCWKWSLRSEALQRLEQLRIGFAAGALPLEVRLQHGVPQRIHDRGSGRLTGAPLSHRGHQGRELPAEAGGCKSFQRYQRPAYVIDTDVMPVTTGSRNSAHQKHCGEMKTGPPAWRLTQSARQPD